MLQESDMRNSSGGRGPTSNIGQKQHRGGQNDQDKSQCESFDYKSHVHPRKNPAIMGVEFTTAKWPAQLPEMQCGPNRRFPGARWIRDPNSYPTAQGQYLCSSTIMLFDVKSQTSSGPLFEAKSEVITK